MTNPTKITRVPHLGGIDVGYCMPLPYDPSKPTIVLVNSFTTNSTLFRPQFNEEQLTALANLIAIEPLGHGSTRALKTEQFTYWDTAIMNLQVLESLGIKSAFVCGTSQGGWITVRMALLDRGKIDGIIPLGTSMDSESPRTMALGCWDGFKIGTDTINDWSSKVPTPDFIPSDGYCNFLVDIGIGEDCDSALRSLVAKEIKEDYTGDDGRRRAKMAAINLRDRDGLHARLDGVYCPVLWIHGTSDVVYSLANAREEIRLFTSSPSAELKTIQDGRHFLSASHPAEVNKSIVAFVRKWQKRRSAKL